MIEGDRRAKSQKGKLENEIGVMHFFSIK